MGRLSRAMLLLLLAAGAAGAGERRTLVVWAPGYPGDTEQARPTLDAFAEGVTRAAGLRAGTLAAIYHNTVEDGLAALSEPRVALALVPTPVLFEYGERLRLRPLLQAHPVAGADEVWSVVAARGRIASAADLAGWELTGMAGYAPGFVRGPVLGAWGALPESTRIAFTPRVLSALRRAAAGEDVAVLADASQAAALATLPFAGELEIVTRSPALPATFLCEVAGRLPAGESSRLREALTGLDATDSGRSLLGSLRLQRFSPLEPARLAWLPAAAGGPAR